MDVVEITRSLDRVEAQPQERIVCLAVSVLLHVPTRGFYRMSTKIQSSTRTLGSGLTRTEEDAKAERNGRNEGRTNLQTPGNRSDLVHGKIGAESQEDSKGRPHLPRHDQSTTDPCWCIFGGEDRDSSALQTHTDAHEKTCDEELLPGLSDSTADGSKNTEDSRDKNGTATTKVVVARVREPAATSNR